MKSMFLKLSAAVIAALLITPVAIHAQDEKDKEKDKSEKKGADQIIITRKADNKDKVVVEINGDKVTINGKPAEDFKEGDISVRVHKLRDGSAFTYNWNGNDNMFLSDNENTAMLGVVTDKVDEGVKITDVTDESGAEKAGLKEDDIITKVDDKKIEDPDDLTKVIRGHKPGDKVTITYLRDKKEAKTTAELTKWRGAGFNAFTKIPDMNWNMIAPKIEAMPKFKMSPGQYYAFGDNRPRLGLSVQDTEDGKGVKVTDVDEDGTGAKAGIKEDDIIVAVNDKEVNSADEVARIVRENKDKTSMMFKIKRDGKVQNIEVRIPRKLKTADL